MRDLFLPPALEVAPRLLGGLLTLDGSALGEHDLEASRDNRLEAPGDNRLKALGSVTVRITEVEAYHGVGVPGPYDAGSHSRDRRTERNSSMFGPPGHAYVYFSYGMHFALNMVCSPEGSASGVLIRAGEVVAGETVARARREAKRGSGAAIPGRLLARGPGNLAAALGIRRDRHDGLDLLAAPFAFTPSPEPPPAISNGPRVGVAGAAGGPAFPWRFWIAGDPTVSAFRPGRGAPRT